MRVTWPQIKRMFFKIKTTFPISQVHNQIKPAHFSNEILFSFIECNFKNELKNENLIEL